MPQRVRKEVMQLGELFPSNKRRNGLHRLLYSKHYVCEFVTTPKLLPLLHPPSSPLHPFPLVSAAVRALSHPAQSRAMKFILLQPPPSCDCGKAYREIIPDSILQQEEAWKSTQFNSASQCTKIEAATPEQPRKVR